ncbi:membrane protein insertase YidC 1 [Firmicutes bacterium CAG:884]|nr:YidC/Oxa1 family membrane protein insertase [Bacillota bacterium]CCY93301.1 membrane protein insertase YidC 1 [Firmicutes bacterium CAG:884]
MKNKSKILILLTILLLTGCTKQLKDTSGQVLRHPITGQGLVENVLCRPENEESIKKYEEAGIDINKYPTCKEFSPFKTKYEGIWTSVFVKPLAWVILKIGYVVKDYGLALIIITIIIRLILYPLTNKTAMQSENLAKAKPELDRLEKKYAGKNDQDSMMKKSQEMMLIYKKYNINPLSSCLFAFIQIPLLIAFYEAMNRLPAIFEGKFLHIVDLGKTASSAFTDVINGASALNLLYILLPIIVTLVTHFSFKLNKTATETNDNMMKFMPIYMVGIIGFSSIFISTAICLYWITNSTFTIVQNLIVKRRAQNAK